MLGLWSVANFAVKSCVPAQLLLAYDVRVTGFTGLVPGMSRGPGRYLRDGGAAVMSILAEGFGDYGRA